MEVSFKEGESWKKWEPLPTRAFAWVRPRTTNYGLTATVPLPTTNGPLRVVFELKTSSKTEFWQFVEHFGPDWMVPKRTYRMSAEFNFEAETNALPR